MKFILASFLANILIRFINIIFIRCVACKNDEKQYLMEENAVNHLKTHSPFFARKPEKYLEIVCRICNTRLPDSSPETVTQHHLVSHPLQMFATDEDVAESRGHARDHCDDNTGSRWDNDDSLENNTDDQPRLREADDETQIADINAAAAVDQNINSGVVDEETKEYKPIIKAPAPASTFGAPIKIKQEAGVKREPEDEPNPRENVLKHQSETARESSNAVISNDKDKEDGESSRKPRISMKGRRKVEF